MKRILILIGIVLLGCGIMAGVLSCGDIPIQYGVVRVEFNLNDTRAVTYDWEMVVSGKAFLKQGGVTKSDTDLALNKTVKTGSCTLPAVLLGNYDIIVELYDDQGLIVYRGEDTVDINQMDCGVKTITLQRNAGVLSASGMWTEAIPGITSAELYLKQDGVAEYSTNMAVDTGLKTVSGNIDNIYPGSYEINILVKNAEDDILFEGSTEYDIALGDNIAVISLFVKTGSVGIQINGDVTAPVITNGPSYSVAGTTVTISWTTNELATSNICWSETAGFDYQTQLNWVPAGRDITVDKTSHSVAVTGLTEGSTYYYVVYTADACGNVRVSDEGSFVMAGFWAKTIGGTGDDMVGSIAFDGFGNLYLTGYFTGTVDFDPEMGIDNKTSQGGKDIFLTKFSDNGTYLWTKTFGGTGDDFQSGGNQNMLAIDGNNNIFIAAYFSESVDFDPGVGTDIQNSNGYIDACLIKINADGSYGWTKTLGGSQGAELAESIIIDNNENLFVGGYIESSNIDFDPGPGQDLGSGIGQSPFIWKINSDGSYGWKKIFNINIPGYAGLKTLRLDNSQNLFALGHYEYTMDFDPGAGIDNKTAGGRYDLFLTKINNDGSYGGTKTIGSDGGYNSQQSFDLLLKSNGEMYYTGWIQKNTGSGEVDMDPTIGTDIKNPVNGGDFFITKLTAENIYAWTRLWIGSGNSYAHSITAIENGDYYLSGCYTGTMDFNPEAGVDEKTALGSSDVFIIKFNADDSYAWTKTIGGDTLNSYGSCIRSFDNYIYLAGYFNGTVDFDPGPDVYEKAAVGGKDIFIVKLEQ